MFMVEVQVLPVLVNCLLALGLSPSQRVAYLHQEARNIPTSLLAAALDQPVLGLGLLALGLEEVQLQHRVLIPPQSPRLRM